MLPTPPAPLPPNESATPRGAATWACRRWVRRRSSADPERRLRHGFDRFHRGDSCFVSARGGDHVDHFLDDVDVRISNVAFCIRVGMTGLVDHLRIARVLLNSLNFDERYGGFVGTT